MKTQIQSIHFDADKKLLDFIDNKLDKISKIYNRIESCNVILRLDKNDQNKNKIVEISINIPGIRLFAEDRSENFEMAFEMAIDEIKKQLLKHKEKISIHSIEIDQD